MQSQVVLDLGHHSGDGAATSAEASAQAAHQHLHSHDTSDEQQLGAAAAADAAGGASPSTPTGLISVLVRTMQSSMPFFFILVAKIFHEHLIGFFIVLGFLTTLHWSNRTLVGQVELKVCSAQMLISFFILKLEYIYFLFAGEETKLQARSAHNVPHIQRSHILLHIQRIAPRELVSNTCIVI